MLRSMMSQKDLPISFWGYALETAVFILNRISSKVVEKTPYEIWNENKRPLMSFLRIWGCEALVKRQVLEKLAPRSDKCIFVGYPKETRGYDFYNRSEKKLFVARNGVFLEKQFISKGNSGSKVLLKEVKELQITAEDRNEIQDDSQDVVEFESVTQGPRRSGRIRHEPKRYGFLITDDKGTVLVVHK